MLLAGSGTRVRRAGRRAWRRAVAGAGRERLRWALRIRWAVIALFLVVALVAVWVGTLRSLAPALAAAALGTAMNAAARRRVRLWHGIPAVIAWTGAGDALLITWVVWATGGLQSPFLLLYVVQVLTTALMVGLGVAALGATLGLGLLGTAVALVPPPAPVAGSGAERHVWLLALALTLVLLVFIGGHLARRLARSERRLEGMHRRLARSWQRLSNAHTALREAYARLAAAEAHLVASEKLRALGVLVAGLAHELGNPLTVLAGNLEPLAALLASYERALAVPAHPADDAPAGAVAALDDPRARRVEAAALLANCREATARAVELLARLREFGRGGAGGVRRRGPMVPGLVSTLALARHRLPPGVRVHEDYAEVPDVWGVPAELNQVFMNLLLNAADALAPGGNLWLIVRREGDEVWATVRDDGVGIPPELVPRVCEPFFTTKDVGQGSGLGLAISQAIAARHGGRLLIHAPPAGGTEITLCLPCSAADTADPPGVRQVPPTAFRGSQPLNARGPSAPARPGDRAGPRRGN